VLTACKQRGQLRQCIAIYGSTKCDRAVHTECLQVPQLCVILALKKVSAFGFCCAGWGTQLKVKSRGFHSRWGHRIFHWLNPSGFNVTVGSTQPLAAVGIRDVSWVSRCP
jgi:hypothetical protein